MKIELQFFVEKGVVSVTEQEKEKMRLFHFDVSITSHEKKAQMNPIHTHATAKEVDGIRSVHIEGSKLGHSLQISSSAGFKELSKKDPQIASKIEVCLKYMLDHAKELAL